MDLEGEKPVSSLGLWKEILWLRSSIQPDFEKKATDVPKPESERTQHGKGLQTWGTAKWKIPYLDIISNYTISWHTTTWPDKSMLISSARSVKDHYNANLTRIWEKEDTSTQVYLSILSPYIQNCKLELGPVDTSWTWASWYKGTNFERPTARSILRDQQPDPFWETNSQIHFERPTARSCCKYRHTKIPQPLTVYNTPTPSSLHLNQTNTDFWRIQLLTR